MAAAWYSNVHLVHIVAIVLLGKFSAFHAITVDEFGEGIGRKLYREKKVYDVSQVIRSNENHNQSEILPGNLFVLEVNTSANYYFVANDAAEDDICWKDWKCRYFGIKGISLILNDKANKTDVLALEYEPIINTTIENLLKIENSSIESVTFLLRDNAYCGYTSNINNYFVEKIQIGSIKQSIQVGIEYNDEFLERCADEWVPIFDYLSHTVLRIHVSPMTTMLSYGVFSRNVLRLVEENRKFVRNFCPQCTQYIRLHNEDWNTTLSPDNYEKYNALMTGYLDAFSKQNTGNEIFIFNPILKQVNIVRNMDFLRQNVSFFLDHIEGKPFENASSHEKHVLACAHQRMAKLLFSNVQNIIVYDPFLEVLSSLSATCNTSTENRQTHFNTPSNTSLSLVLDYGITKLAIDKQVEKILENIGNNLSGIKIATVYTQAEDFNDTENWTKAVNLLQSKNIDAGCAGTGRWQQIQIETANVSAIFGRGIQKCSAFMNLSKEILVFVRFKIRKAEDVLTLLIRSDQAKQHFERLYPGKMLILNINLLTEINRESLYCSARVKQSKEYFQTVYSYAQIQGWSRVLLRNPFNEFAFWSRVRTDYDFSKIEKKRFPVLFRSNAPLTADKELPMTYHCIQRTWDTKGSNINFLENQYSGATFQSNLRENQQLLTPELQNLLDLAMSQFPSVEIIAVSRSDFKRLENVIANIAPSKHSLLNISMPLVYVEVPLAEVYGLQQEIHTVLSNKHVAVHVSNWESLSSKQLNQWKGFQYTSTANFGVTAHNCSLDIGSKVTALKSLPFFSQVSYMVCDTSPVVPDNTDSDWMEKYLGTLFYTKSYMEYFLAIGRETGNGVEVVFRLNNICSKVNDMEPFLRFLNDVNQHSAAYKIRYFLVRAVEGETDKNCVNSWWRPDSYDDLANISTYVNREDEYAGRKDRILLPSSVPEQNSNTVYFLIVVPVVALLMFGMLAQCLYQRKLKTKILTGREVRQFYNGGEHSNPSSGKEYYLDFGNMKFPKNYEIPRKDIQTEEIVGSGQFGVVHRGILSKRTEVAIKIPRSDCGKEQFKSTLSELKILCHIGEHLNIVSFLGACTKGIANGKLSIVIEYCKNGCLLKYLRENRENDEENGISLYQMNGFSHQIASGMEFIAEKRVIHGDLAARNVLLTAEMTCKIADFGLSRRLYEMDEYVKTSQEPLPWRWMAPESLRDMEFTTKSDVWSYGVTLWEIFSLGMVPYSGLNWTVNYVNELENGMRMGKAPYATDDIHAKILECWNMSSEARPTFKELKDFFVGLRNEQYLTLNKV